MADQISKLDIDLFLPHTWEEWADTHTLDRYAREYLCQPIPEPERPRNLTLREEHELRELKKLGSKEMAMFPPIEVKIDPSVDPGDILIKRGDRVIGKMKNVEMGCDHPGCTSHISHPCEKCGRQWGPTTKKKIMHRKDAFWR